MPAAASASLWIGAVTMPATSPARARSTAARIEQAAAAPARASTRPGGASASAAASMPGACSTGTAPGGQAATSAAASISITGSRPPVQATARRIAPTSPTTKAPRAAPRRNAWATISGPMPQASPMVSASGRSVRCEAVSAGMAGAGH